MGARYNYSKIDIEMEIQTIIRRQKKSIKYYYSYANFVIIELMSLMGFTEINGH